MAKKYKFIQITWLLKVFKKREMDPALKSRTLRAIEYLQAFDLDIRRVPENKNVVADALSWFSIEANGISVVETDPEFH